MKLMDGAGTAILDHELNLDIKGASNSFQMEGAYVLEDFMEVLPH